MRLILVLILGPLLALGGMGLNATMGQADDDDPPPKKGPKDDRKGPPKGDRKGKDDRKGGPKHDDDGPPPRRGPGGPPDLRRMVEDMDLTRAQREKARKAIDNHHDNMREIVEKAHRELLAELKKALPAEEYRKVAEMIQRRPKGPPKHDRKGPKDDRDDDRRGPKGGAERIPAPRQEREGGDDRDQ